MTETDTDGDGDHRSNSYMMIPGCKSQKDPKVTVKTGSADCMVFVEVKMLNNCDDYITYSIASGWNKLTKDAEGNSITGVYWREVPASPTDLDFFIFEGADVEGMENGCITVKESVTKEMADKIEDNPDNMPQINFLAYAIQLSKDESQKFSPAEAWEHVSKI